MNASAKVLEKSEKAIKAYQDETARIESEIKELESRPITFQASKCELCKQALELPAFHFLCRHSFHAKCLGDMTQECPRCSPELHLMEEMIKTQLEASNDHSSFQNKVYFALLGSY